MHSIARRMQYAPHLPLPFVLSHTDEEYKEGSVICTRDKEIKLRGGAVVRLTVPRASDDFFRALWDTPNSWMQVTPVDDQQEQQRLEQIHEKEVAEAEAYASRGYGYGRDHDADDEEEWDEQTVPWHDDEAWSWAFIPPEATRGSPWHWQEPEEDASSVSIIIPPRSEAGPSLAPQPAPSSEGAPDSPSSFPTPEGWPTSWGSSSGATQPSPGGWG